MAVVNIKHSIIHLCKEWENITSYSNTMFLLFIEQIQETLLDNIICLKDFEANDIPTKPGIYCFYVDKFNYTDYNEFCSAWDKNCKNKNRLKGLSRPTKTRFEKDQNRGAESGKTVFYIGKRNNIKSRICEHIQHTESGTYGLKLSRSGGGVFKNQMHFSYWVLPEDLLQLDKEFQTMLLTTIEHKLFDLWNPRVGKK